MMKSFRAHPLGYYSTGVFVIQLWLWPVLHAAERHVGAGKDFKTIRAALAAAVDGDRIVIHGGSYREGNILVDKRVTIEGVDWPEIDGEGRSEVWTLTVSGTVIRRLTVRNSGVSYIQENAAIKIKEADGCEIADNRLENNFFAIYLSKSHGCVVRGNVILGTGQRESNTGNGIHLWSSNDTVIEDNRVEGHRDGIYFEFARRGTIRHNVSRRNLRYGLHFMFSDSCDYSKNTFTHNSAGVAVMYSRHVTMIENVFEDNWGSASYGILLKDISDSRLERNVFRHNTVGVYSEGCVRLQIRHNDMEGNGWAVKIMANSTDNVFQYNNFLGNAFDVSTNSRRNPNTFRGNHWSSYAGYDLKKDGIGDVPFRPVRLFSLMVDQYPASLILLRCFFVELLDVAERVFPMLTPETLIDEEPHLKPVPHV